jgi:hypothetical protein
VKTLNFAQKRDLYPNPRQKGGVLQVPHQNSDRKSLK